MKQIYIAAILLLNTSFIFAQSASFEWVKSWETDRWHEITVDGNGNSFIVMEFKDTMDVDPGPGVQYMSAIGSSDILIEKIDPSGNLIWAKSIGSNTGDYLYGITLDPSGNIIIMGMYHNTIDFDPGPSVYHLPDTNANGTFILKLNPDGNFLWAKIIETGSALNPSFMSTDKSGNILITGDHYGTTDFDPGPGIFQLHSSSTWNDIFIVKLDSSGDLKWAFSMGNVSGWYKGDFCIMADDAENVLVTGHFTSTTDFDPGPGTHMLTASGIFYNTFLLKLDKFGNFKWANTIGDSTMGQGFSLTIDQDLNIYDIGSFGGTVDLDPGPGTFMLTCTTINSCVYTRKLDSTGKFIWGHALENVSTFASPIITIDNQGDLYFIGNHIDTVDLDPGPGVFNLYPPGGFFIQKLDSAGNLIYAKAIAKTQQGFFHLAKSFDSDNIFIAGYFSDTVDFDPDTSMAYLAAKKFTDTFLLKLTQDSCNSLSIAIDSVHQINCTNSTAYASAHAFNGTPPYSYSWNTIPPTASNATNFNSSGIYRMDVTDSTGCQRHANVLINPGPTTTGFDFNVNLSTGSYRTGFSSTIALDAFNNGCTSITGQLMLILDPLTSYDSASIAPTNIFGDTLIWNLGIINFDDSHFQPLVFVTCSTLAAIGDSVHLQTNITPIGGDFNPNNNTKNYSYPVINGYDPNDKQVYPQGECFEKYILDNEVLTYTIRFQNTGNTSAINIHILDGLSEDLDISTVDVISSSHSMHTEVIDSQILKFVFNNINLPDSGSDQLGSQGFVIFEVEPKPGIAFETKIFNTSEIYFDFNPAVFTNTIRNTFVDIIPDCIIGFNEIQTSTNDISIYPNPTYSRLTVESGKHQIQKIKIFNLLGKLELTYKSGFQNMNVEGLARGIYVIHVETNNGMFQRKLVIKD